MDSGQSGLRTDSGQSDLNTDSGQSGRSEVCGQSGLWSVWPGRGLWSVRTDRQAGLDELVHVDGARVAALSQPVQAADARARRAVVAVARRRHARLVAVHRQPLGRAPATRHGGQSCCRLWDRDRGGEGWRGREGREGRMERGRRGRGGWVEKCGVEMGAK